MQKKRRSFADGRRFLNGTGVVSDRSGHAAPDLGLVFQAERVAVLHEIRFGASQNKGRKANQGQTGCSDKIHQSNSPQDISAKWD